MPKILVIRFSSIGDIVLTSPVVRCLSKQIPGAEIHFLTKNINNKLLEANVYIKKIHLFDRSLSELIVKLKFEKFDYVVDLHNNIRSRRVRLGLGVKSFTFDKLNIRKWLMVRLKLNLLPKQHIIDRYFKAIAKLGVVNDGAGCDFFIPEKDKVALSHLPPSHQNGYIGFVIGANYSTKRLPLYKIISLCKKINKPIVLLGWKSEECYGDQIYKELPELVYNACGAYNINQSASLVQQASMVISHDTGLMHIAAAYKKRIVSIWGNTIPDFGMTPYMDASLFKTVEVKGLSCRPCSKIGYSRCPKGHFKCMNLINEAEIVALVEDWQKMDVLQ